MMAKKLNLVILAKEMFEHRLLYAVLFVFSACSVFDIVLSPQFGLALFYQIIFVICVSACKAILILLPLVWLLRNRYTLVLSYAVISIFGVLSIVNLTCYLLYGFGVTRKLILIAAQTTRAEIKGFLPQLLFNLEEALYSMWFWMAVVLLVAFFVMIHKTRFKPFIWSSCSLALLGIIAYVIFSLSFTAGRTAVLISARLLKYGREVVIWNNNYKDLLRRRKELPFVDSIKSGHLAKNVIVVIGESASRSHHSVYGYSLPTTPHLCAVQDSLFVFSNAIGSSTSTSGNLERILSFKNDDEVSGDGLNYPTLVGVFEKAGYKTFWLSNQERTGSVSNTSGAMITDASVIKYLGADNCDDVLAVKYDDVLLPELQTALDDSTGHRLIFLHLLGSHTQYRSRYPDEFDVFTSEDEIENFNRPWLNNRMASIVAEYDNSILFTDYILWKVLNKVDCDKNAALMIYFSDHGECVYDDGSFWGRDEKFVEVPLIVFANEKYRQDNPDIINLLFESVDRKMSTANFVYLLLTLTGTEYELYDATMDALSPDFQDRKRLVDEQVWRYE